MSRHQDTRQSPRTVVASARCIRLAAALSLLAGGCVVPNPEYCDETRPCQAGVCDLPNHTCVEGLDGPGGSDAVADAPPGIDAPVGPPIVDTFQQADLVLGQATFTTDADAGCVATAAAAEAVAEANGVVYVREIRSRALAWSPLPSGNNAAATRVLGRSSFTTCSATPGIDAITFGARGDLVAAGGKLALADYDRNRVMLWNPSPTASGEAADVVLGRPDFSTNGTGTGAHQMSGAWGVWTDGNKVVVADTLNHRVLIWTTFPTTNGQPANRVIGQTGFDLGGAPASPSATRLNSPHGVWSDGTRLAVADTGHNRVLIWNTFPTSNGQAADIVLGQSGFAAGGTGLSAVTMNQPYAVGGNDDALFVADTTNDRVLVFQPFPTASGEAARFVLGQPDLDAGANDPSPTRQTLDGPRHLFVSGDRLWVADTQHRRTLRFALYP